MEYFCKFGISNTNYSLIWIFSESIERANFQLPVLWEDKNTHVYAYFTIRSDWYVYFSIFYQIAWIWYWNVQRRLHAMLFLYDNKTTENTENEKRKFYAKTCCCYMFWVISSWTYSIYDSKWNFTIHNKWFWPLINRKFIVSDITCVSESHKM